MKERQRVAQRSQRDVVLNREVEGKPCPYALPPNRVDINVLAAVEAVRAGSRGQVVVRLAGWETAAFGWSNASSRVDVLSKGAAYLARQAQFDMTREGLEP